MFRPRTSGNLPWDVDKNVRQKQLTARRHPVPSRTQSEGDKYSHLDIIDREELLDEAALLKELDEVLSSTSESASIKSKANHRLKNVAKRNKQEVSQEKQNNDLAMLHIQGNRVGQAPVRELDTMDYQEEHMTGANERSSQRHDARTPRYQGQYTNYEEMLKNMDAEDPFNKRDASAVDRKPPVPVAASRATQPQRTVPKINYSRSVSVKQKPTDHTHEVESQQAQNNYLKVKPRKSPKAAEVMNTLSALYGIENLAMDNTDQGSSRRDSLESQKTYIVGRTDSRIAVEDDQSHNVAKVTKKSLTEVSASVVNLRNLRKKFLISDKPKANKDDPHLNEVRQYNLPSSLKGYL